MNILQCGITEPYNRIPMDLKYKEARKMGQWLRALTAFPED